MKRVLITGANGFVGSALFKYLLTLSYDVIGAVRNKDLDFDYQNRCFSVGDINETTDWGLALDKVDVVVHTAGRAHVFTDKSMNPREEFLRVNMKAAVNLAKQSLEAGVKRFVFVSSIGVNGVITDSKPFSELDAPNPISDYTYSKFCAEVELKRLCEGQAMELVIVRPPLIYSSNAPGNFAKLLRVVRKGYPLPFSYRGNKRSFISINNFINFLECVITHPMAANQLFVVSDDQSISISELTECLFVGMSKPVNLFYIPPVLIKLLCHLIGRASMYQQLFCSLEIDNTKAKTMLNWHPPYSARDALTQAGREYVSNGS